MTVKELINRLKELDPKTEMFTIMYSEFRDLENNDITVFKKEGIEGQYGLEYLLRRPDGNVMICQKRWMTGDPKLDGNPIDGVFFHGN